ncbi:MAG TPA: hypothetical protein VE198_15210 [Actinoallomurus sp.]|nr:hypothetical protein [Actinoallomurus sp.]
MLDVRCDPDIPPIPPHADFEQIKDAAEAVMKGDPDASGLMRKGLNQGPGALRPGQGLMGVSSEGGAAA